MDKKYMRLIYGSMFALAGIVMIMMAAETSLLAIMLASAIWMCVMQIVVNYFEMNDNPAPNYFAVVHIIGCIMAVIFSVLGWQWGQKISMMIIKRFF